MHSHIGVHRGLANVRGAMTKNRMLVVARKIVADRAVIRSVPGQGFRMFREPAPGELAKRFDELLEQMRTQHKSEGLAEIVPVEALDRAVRANEPAVVLAAEGGDFLEGDLKRLEAAFSFDRGSVTPLVA